jgi:hypothetical protein
MMSHGLSDSLEYPSREQQVLRCVASEKRTLHHQYRHDSAIGESRIAILPSSESGQPVPRRRRLRLARARSETARDRCGGPDHVEVQRSSDSRTEAQAPRCEVENGPGARHPSLPPSVMVEDGPQRLPGPLSRPWKSECWFPGSAVGRGPPRRRVPRVRCLPYATRWSAGVRMSTDGGFERLERATAGLLRHGTVQRLRGRSGTGPPGTVDRGAERGRRP